MEKTYLPLFDKKKLQNLLLSFLFFFFSSFNRTNPPILNLRIYPANITKGTPCNVTVNILATSLRKYNEIKFLSLTN